MSELLCAKRLEKQIRNFPFLYVDCRQSFWDDHWGERSRFSFNEEFSERKVDNNFLYFYTVRKKRKFAQSFHIIFGLQVLYPSKHQSIIENKIESMLCKIDINGFVFSKKNFFFEHRLNSTYCSSSIVSLSSIFRKFDFLFL